MPHTIVRASAGAGKTYELTSQYIDLLHKGHLPNGILATTFTRKAAGEILGRLLARLSKAAQYPKDAAELAAELNDPALSADRCRQLLADLCRSLHVVSICTIDSFFARMATCFHHELDVPLTAVMVGESDAAAVQLRAEAIDAMLADDDLQILLEMMSRLHHDSATLSVTSFIDDQVASLYNIYRQTPGAAAWSRLKAPPPPDKQTLDQATAEIVKLIDTTDKSWPGRLAEALEVIRARNWDTLLSKGFASRIADGSCTYYRKPIPDEIVAAIRPFVDLAIADVKRQVVHRTEATYDLLRRFDTHYTRLRQLHGVLLFGDLPHKLAFRLPELGDDVMDEVYYRLDARVSHLMLDEFQDTSNEQWDILRPFANETTAYSDASRTFFCVGDTKQAIYGWRGGCAELFDQIQGDLSLPDESVHSRNESFRSSQVVLDAVNSVFGQIDQTPALTPHADVVRNWQTRFDSHKAHFDKPGYVELITSHGNDEPTEDDDEPAIYSRPDHLAFAADRIAELVNQMPSKTIGVLVPINAVVPLLIEMLQQDHGLPASGEGGSPVTDDPAVAAVLAAMTMADHPGNSAAAFHVLNSPMGNVVGINRVESLHVADVAMNIRSNLLAHGYAATIGTWAQQLAGDCKQRSAIRLAQLVELAERYDPDISLRPGDFIEFAKSTVVEEPTRASVRVMTIYKAKGLEFDIVVLPILTRKMGQLTAAVYVDRKHPTAPVRGVYSSAKESVRSLFPELRDAYGQETARRLNDDLSVLYVAMTRAKHALHMIVPPLTPKKDGSPGSIGMCYAAILRSALGRDDEHLGRQQTLYQHGDPGWAYEHDAVAQSKPSDSSQPTWRLPARLPETPGGPKRSWPRVSPSALAHGDQLEVAKLFDLASATAMLRGSVIHTWFEQIRWASDPIPDDKALRSIGRHVAPQAADDWLRRQLDAFKRMATDPGVVAALSEPATAPSGRVELWRERQFAVRLDGQMVTGRFDRVVVTYAPDGKAEKAELIDFKTDHVDAESLDELTARYQPQIDTYRGALCRMLNLGERAVIGRLLYVQAGKCQTCA